MICPRCGARLDEDSKFCEVCGNPVQAADRPETEPAAVPSERSAEVESEPAAVPSERSGEVKKEAAAVPSEKSAEVKKEAAENPLPVSGKKTLSKGEMICLAIGTVFIVIGFIRIATAGTSISSTSFGADFYTYTYQGIVAVAEILASIEVTLGWILAAIGASIDIRVLLGCL